MSEARGEDPTPVARFVAEDRTSVLENYPHTCPRCGGALPVTRARFPLRFSAKAAMLLLCGGVLALVSCVALFPLFMLLFGGGFWVPGTSLIERALRMRREYHVRCGHCGFSFRVAEPEYE